MRCRPTSRPTGRPAWCGGDLVDGALYGVPNEIDLYALNYNKRLFEAAGIDGPPTTWDELIADAKALTVRDGDRITQQGFGLINSWAAGVVHPFASLLASNGGDSHQRRRQARARLTAGARDVPALREPGVRGEA